MIDRVSLAQVASDPPRPPPQQSQASLPTHPAALTGARLRLRCPGCPCAYIVEQTSNCFEQGAPSRALSTCGVHRTLSCFDEPDIGDLLCIFLFRTGSHVVQGTLTSYKRGQVFHGLYWRQAQYLRHVQPRSLTQSRLCYNHHTLSVVISSMPTVIQLGCCRLPTPRALQSSVQDSQPLSQEGLGSRGPRSSRRALETFQKVASYSFWREKTRCSTPLTHRFNMS